MKQSTKNLLTIPTLTFLLIAVIISIFVSTEKVGAIDPVRVPLPDYVPSLDLIGGNNGLNEFITGTVTTANIGVADATRTSVTHVFGTRYWRNAAGDWVLENVRADFRFSVPPLRSGGYQQNDITFPCGPMSDGIDHKWQIIAIADDGNIIRESVENNNKISQHTECPNY